MSTSQDFWARKEAKNNPQPLPVPQSDQPWWRIVPQQSVNQQMPAQQEVEERGHDFSKAASRKQSSRCPECDSGNFMKVTSSTAARCWECGYVEGREIADVGRPLGNTADGGPARSTRQVQNVRILDGQGRDTGQKISSNGNRGNISTANEAAAYVGGI
jgi:hypothetical protein